MRALVKALDLITLASRNEQTAAHGLRAAMRRSNAVISNTRRSSKAEETKETLQPFLVAVNLAQIVIRRRRGLRVSNKLYQDALQLVEDTAKAWSLEISTAMEENESPAWPRVKIARELDQIAVGQRYDPIRLAVRFRSGNERPPRTTSRRLGSSGRRSDKIERCHYADCWRDATVESGALNLPEIAAMY